MYSPHKMAEQQYDSDEILSQALDYIEEQEESAIFVTQNTYRNARVGVDRSAGSTSLIQLIRPYQFERSWNTDEGPVSAFAVEVLASAPTTHGISGVVLFTTTVYDASDDYDVTTGVFTCRHAGVYFFALSLVKYKTGTIDGYIYKGSEALVRAYVRASIAETSAFVTTKLFPGDAVFVGGGTGVTGMSTYSAFSGFLVTAG